jgi:hypothetical protein
VINLVPFTTLSDFGSYDDWMSNYYNTNNNGTLTSDALSFTDSESFRMKEMEVFEIAFSQIVRGCQTYSNSRLLYELTRNACAKPPNA